MRVIRLFRICINYEVYQQDEAEKGQVVLDILVSPQEERILAH